MTTNEDRLYSIVLILTPTAKVTVGATMGHQAHAAFLQTVREVDPALAEALHAPELRVRPFTVSPLRGLPRAREGRVGLDPGRDYWLRFTALQPRIYERFMARFLRGGAHPLLRLGRAELLIKEIRTTPGSHPWAGYTSWAQLIGEAGSSSEIALAFATPTAFGFGQKAWGKMSVVLPEPTLVFGSLARSWNALTPPPLHVDRSALRACVEENVVVSRIDGLRTHVLQFRRAPQIGFVGRVTYRLMAPDVPMQACLNALAELALYTGVGSKTTMGMGQARRIRALPRRAG